MASRTDFNASEAAKIKKIKGEMLQLLDQLASANWIKAPVMLRSASNEPVTISDCYVKLVLAGEFSKDSIDFTEKVLRNGLDCLRERKWKMESEIKSASSFSLSQPLNTFEEKSNTGSVASADLRAIFPFDIIRSSDDALSFVDATQRLDMAPNVYTGFVLTYEMRKKGVLAEIIMLGLQSEAIRLSVFELPGMALASSPISSALKTGAKLERQAINKRDPHELGKAAAAYLDQERREMEVQDATTKIRCSTQAMVSLLSKMKPGLGKLSILADEAKGNFEDALDTSAGANQRFATAVFNRCDTEAIITYVAGKLEKEQTPESCDAASALRAVGLFPDTTSSSPECVEFCQSAVTLWASEGRNKVLEAINELVASPELSRATGLRR